MSAIDDYSIAGSQLELHSAFDQRSGVDRRAVRGRDRLHNREPQA
jgi:hypothetical protein